MLPMVKAISPTLRCHPTNIVYRSLATFSVEPCIRYIERCTKGRSLPLGRSVHAHLIINGLDGLTHYAFKLVSMYFGCGEISIARKLFDRIPQTNYGRWIFLIGAYAKCGFYKEALLLFREIQREGVRPNKYVLPSVLKACGHLSECWIGKEVHGLILKYSLHLDAFVSTALIDMYSKCGLVKNARRVFDGMPEMDLVGLNAMVSGYVQGGLVKEAFYLVRDTQSAGLKLDVVTWNTLIAGFSQEGDDLMVNQLLKLMRGSGVEPDVVSWTSIISGFVQNFRPRDAFAMFKKMLDAGYSPSSNTISGLLPACANVANIRWGREIHGYGLVIGVGEDVYVKSALLDMYAKCGLIVEASILFQKMIKRTSVSWNAMIFGYANHGCCNEAILLFQRMEQEEEDKLDHMTFTAALTACSHGGMIELGKNLFKSMQEKYRITPRLEHYAVMVDLLGRAGRVTEAYYFIRTMPIEPDSFVWGALLGTCRQHGDVGIAEVAAEHLAVLEPRSAGSSLLLCDLYSESGSWSHAVKLKKSLKSKKLIIFSGCSWTETS